MFDDYPYQVEVTSRCTRCGGATWQLQAHDICGQCGRITQHETPEVRMVWSATRDAMKKSHALNCCEPEPAN